MIYTAFTMVRQPASEEIAWAEIYAPPGTRTRFLLPDGTKGWLNSDTKLNYPLNFKQNRHLNLSGEAYFEVTKNRDLPFVVTTSNLDIKVLGTIFSVSALLAENTTEVILEEGSVEIDNPGTGLKAMLKPDQKFIFDNLNKENQTVSVNAQQYNAWKDGMLVFRNEPLAEVFKRLSRWYNVKITISDEQIKRYKYRATFQNEPIEEVIRLIAMTLPIEYKIEKRAYDDQGVYAVREIRIMKK
jgi:ferric-dicitrate binding protein FerR (iron transport regulator)